MSSLSYWEKRKAQEMFQYMKKAEDAADEIAKLYQKSSGYLSAELDKIFERFKRKHHLTDEEAYRLLNRLQDKTSIDELKEALRAGGDAERYILAELEGPAYQARLERLQQLQNQLDLTMQEVYKQEKARNTSHYVDLANEAYYRSIFDIQQRTELGFSFSAVDPKAIDRVINSKWSGANYSTRIWHNTRALAQDLKEELLVNLVTGRTDREAAEIISNKFAQGASNSRRLVRTESCNLVNQIEMESYKECEIETYVFVATLDLRTSSVCRGLDGKRFPVSEQQPGKNCPPMHPWCRSTTICDISDDELAQMQRRARNPITGENETVPAGMTYEQWYKKNIKGRLEAEANEKMLRNRSSDKKQFEKYRKILGKYAPETLDSFQKMKYTDGEKWEYIKGLKDYLEKYPTSDKRYYDIGEELKRLGLTKAVVLPPVQKQAYILPEGKHDPYHIMHRMAERHITDDEIRGFMSRAEIMMVQWGGRRQVFYSQDGVCVITKSGDDWIYKTAWKKEDFDSDTGKILEVIKKYVK